MNAFHNVTFPLALSYGVTGGPSCRTDITRLASGGEYRNNPHAASRRRYDAGSGLKSLGDVATLIAFYEARRGQLHGFRLRDPMDYSTAPLGKAVTAQDQILMRADGQTQSFQLFKHYGDDAGSYARLISKPVAATLKVAINGTQSACLVDDLTGLIQFDTPPPENAIISAGFEFDVPVRFDTDYLPLTLETFGAGQLSSIPMIEISDA